MLPKPIQDFVKSFTKLPGVGFKSAERIGFYLLGQSTEWVDHIAKAMINLKANSYICAICGNLSDRDPCPICVDSSRDHAVICVVENPIDVYYIESAHSFYGIYHVLGGVISPLNGITPDKLAINQLISRIDQNNIRELLFATSPTTEGDITVLYIKELLKGRNIKITTLARGIPVGTDLQYAGSNSISQAIKSREEI